MAYDESDAVFQYIHGVAKGKKYKLRIAPDGESLELTNPNGVTESGLSLKAVAKRINAPVTIDYQNGEPYMYFPQGWR